MGLESFNAYHSYLKAIEPLNEAERGRLFTACLEYSMTGIAPELKGNERFVFPSMAAQIDRDKERYTERCRKNSENISKRWNTIEYDGKSRIRNDTKHTKDKDKDKDKDYSPPISPDGDNPPSGGDLVPEPKPKAPAKPKSKSNQAREVIDGWTDDLELRELLYEWLEVRKAQRAANTAGAIQQNLKKLPDLAQESGLSMQDYLREVIRRSWRAFWPIRDYQGGQIAAPARKDDGRDFDWLTGQ